MCDKEIKNQDKKDKRDKNHGEKFKIYSTPISF